MMSTGMPEPSSRTVTELSGWGTTSISSQRPARASSTYGRQPRRRDGAGLAARRADVDTRGEPDGLEAFEDSDVLCGVGSFSHEKSPAISTFAGSQECIRKGGRKTPLRDSARRPGRPARGALRCRSFAPALRPVAVLRGPPRRKARRPPETASRLAGSGIRPGTKRTALGHTRENVGETVEDHRGELAELERPCRRARVHDERTVAADPRRPRISPDRLTDRRRPRGDERGHRTGWPNRRSSRSTPAPIRSIRRPAPSQSRRRATDRGRSAGPPCRSQSRGSGCPVASPWRARPGAYRRVPKARRRAAARVPIGGRR